MGRKEHGFSCIYSLAGSCILNLGRINAVHMLGDRIFLRRNLSRELKSSTENLCGLSLIRNCYSSTCRLLKLAIEAFHS
jgi:hypothetical protein